ncbi:hypothetical protein TcWFU_002816 [Taenia crassiceps]|uniref:Uncharacterized protein n=1 Tax=Taenia crassiceps TaxID=6207 RepID=A0ABR4Q862_9CEST
MVVLDESPRLECWETVVLTADNISNLVDTLDSKPKVMVSGNRTALEVDNNFEDWEWIEALDISRLEKPLKDILGKLASEEDNMNISEVVDKGVMGKWVDMGVANSLVVGSQEVGR